LLAAVEIGSCEDAALACSAVLTQPLSSSPGCCIVPWIRKRSPTVTQESTADFAEPSFLSITSDDEPEADGSMQRCLAEGVFSDEEICRCFESTIRKAELTTLRVDNGEVNEAAESLKFTVEEFVACAYVYVLKYTEGTVSFDDVEKSFNSMVLLRKAIARYFTDDITVAHVERWDFFVQGSNDSCEVATRSLVGRSFSRTTKAPQEDTCV
jgi:hypothetical protein